jgi:hypothetical protein
MHILKINIKQLTLTSILILLFLNSQAQRNKTLRYEDHVYEKNIRSVLFFPSNAPNRIALLPAVLPIMQNFPLILKFDEVNTDEADRYMVKILHCNADWTPSGLNDLEFLNEYNEFSIDEFDFSMATKVHYTHFTYAVPRVKIPGNYLLVVYRYQEISDIIITRRFMVYTNSLNIKSKVGMSSGVSERLIINK